MIKVSSLKIPFFVNRVDFMIRIVESPGQAAEKLCHCQICLKISHISRRVDEPRFPVRSGQDIPAPQISMKEGRKFRFSKPELQPLQDPVGLFH